VPGWGVLRRSGVPEGPLGLGGGRLAGGPQSGASVSAWRGLAGARGLGPESMRGLGGVG